MRSSGSKTMGRDLVASKVVVSVVGTTRSEVNESPIFSLPFQGG